MNSVGLALDEHGAGDLREAREVRSEARGDEAGGEGGPAAGRAAGWPRAARG